MKRYRVDAVLTAIVFSAGMTTGCVEPRVEDVPVYRTEAAGQTPPQYGVQHLYPPPPGTVITPSTNWQSTESVPAYTNPPPALPAEQPPTAVATQAPPPSQVEYVPVAPGPDYSWVPG